MINLSLDELKLVAKNRNIRNYGNKSEKDLIKILSEPKPKIKINKKKLEEIRKYFKELRHTFSRKEIDAYRKLQTSFNIRNKGGKKKSFEIKKNLKFKSFMVILIVFIMMILIVMIIIMILPMMMNTEKLEALEHYLKSLIEIVTNQ